MAIATFARHFGASPFARIRPMATVIFVTIGSRDPLHEGEPLGPLRLAQLHLPDIAILLATEGVAPQAEATRAAILELQPACTVHLEFAERLLPAKDRAELGALPADIEGLLVVGWQVIRKHQSILHDQNAVHVCFSSGTPQESVACTLAVRSLLPHAQHYQALDPRKVPAGSPLLRPFDPDALVRLEARDRMLDALRRGQPAEAIRAAEALSGLANPPWNRKAVDAAFKVALVLGQIDGFDRAAAATWVNNLPPKVGSVAADPCLAEMRQWLTRCVNDDTDWALELAARALRLAGHGTRVAAVLAAATATEALIAAALRASGIDPDDMSKDEVPTDLSDHFRPKDGGIGEVGRLEGVPARLKLLKRRRPELSERIDALEQQREAIASARNKAIHRGRAPQTDHLNITGFLDEFAEALGFSPRPSSLPTAPRGLAEFVEAIRSSL